MYHLPSNWTAQRSAEQELEMSYLARIRMGEAKGAMDSTITTVEKTQGPGHHLILWRLFARKAPRIHNEPVIGIRLPASVQEDNHDIPPCTLEPPFLPSKEILMLRFILLFHRPKMEGDYGPWPRNLSKMLATRQASLRRARIPSSVRDPRVRNAVIGPWIEIPFVNLVTKDGGVELSLLPLEVVIRE
ncbi:hypothetical protein V8E54_014468 [Elaphomyces granulatus]